uniref:Uncharacterized protein n=1 Tax=Trichogramma kaykai TaxID=54128 RepID=A0ABD2W278_9HYME
MPGSVQLQIELNKLLTSQKKRDKTPVAWNPQAIDSFEGLEEETFLCYMMDVKPLLVRHKTSTRPFYYDDLDTCTHIFRVVKSHKQSLQRPYTGPHQVISRDPSKKHMEIHVDNRVIRVSVDQLKLAHFLDQALARQAAVPTDRPPSAPSGGVSLPSAAGMTPLQPSSMVPPPPPAPIVRPQPSASSATATVSPDDLAHARNSQDNAVPDEDSLSLSNFPDMTQDMQDELGLDHSVTAGAAADAPLPPDQPSLSLLSILTQTHRDEQTKEKLHLKIQKEPKTLRCHLTQLQEILLGVPNLIELNLINIKILDLVDFSVLPKLRNLDVSWDRDASNLAARLCWPQLKSLAVFNETHTDRGALDLKGWQVAAGHGVRTAPESRQRYEDRSVSQSIVGDHRNQQRNLIINITI